MNASIIVIILLAAIAADRWRQERHIHLPIVHAVGRRIRAVMHLDRKGPEQATPTVADKH